MRGMAGRSTTRGSFVISEGAACLVLSVVCGRDLRSATENRVPWTSNGCV